jgi:serine/threonine-protein kinase HipA
MINKVEKLTVKYNGRTVGYLAETNNNEIAFQYDTAWIADGFSISPFSLPLTTKVYINKKDTFNGLYGVFQDSLPDGWGALLQYRMLVKQGVNPDRISPLTKLSLLGENGLGALTYEPTQFDDGEIFNIDLDKTASDAALLYEDVTADVNLDAIYKLGGSSGGARPKIHINDKDGFWIVKFPCRTDVPDIGEKEFDANELAVRCGINVNGHKLFPSDICSGYFGAKRFDRTEKSRVHMISLSSLLETSHRIPNLDYMHLFQVIQNICVDKTDIIEAYRRMCFNVLYGNRDDHGRNFAFLYNEKPHGYRLSPAFDITKTSDKPEHEMTVNGHGKPTEDDLLDIARSIKLPMTECVEIIEKVKFILGK